MGVTTSSPLLLRGRHSVQQWPPGEQQGCSTGGAAREAARGVGRSRSRTCPVACCDALQQLPEQAPYQHFVPADFGMAQGCSQVGAAELHDQHMRVRLHAAKMWAAVSATRAAVKLGSFTLAMYELSVRPDTLCSSSFITDAVISKNAQLGIMVLWELMSPSRCSFALKTKRHPAHLCEHIMKGNHIGIIDCLQSCDLTQGSICWICKA